MTTISFNQELPTSGAGRVPASGRIEVTRGQRSNDEDGTTLLPGTVSVLLVDGYASIDIEPTGVDEFVVIDYKTKYPYTRFVQVPLSGSTIADTALVDVDLDSLEPSESGVPAWDIATAAAEAAIVEAQSAATAASASAAEAEAIVDDMVVSGAIVGDDLILSQHDGSTVNAGNVRGPAGADGVAGADGADGPAGADGADGLSAYDIAVAEGFVGDEEAWLLSLVGADGAEGPAGADGVAGADGADGSKWYDGAGAPSGATGVDGDYYLNTTNGDVYEKISGSWGTAVGNIKGATGATGPAGTPGAGVTWLGAWDSGTAYVSNDAVEYNGSAYIANSGSTNKIPGTDPEWDLWVAKGDNGSDGADGAVWYTGSGAPGGGTGADGDFYLDTSNGDVYTKTGGSWGSSIANLVGPAGADGADGTNGTNGSDGADGATILHGSGAPSGGTGADGDYYLDTSNGDFYTKTTGSWGSPVVNLTGPTGDTGAAGADGSDGADGTNGFSPLAYSITGAVTTGTGTMRIYNDTGRTLTISKVRAYAVTGPTGGALVVDVHKNGTTIFTTQGNRPSISSGGNTATGVPDVSTWADGDYLTVDVDTVTGSPADLVVTVSAS